MLMGEYRHNMDAKGRVTMPSRYREELGEKLYVIKGLEECLFVFSEEGLKKLHTSFAQANLEDAMDADRLLFAGGIEVEPDKQGRILLSATLREYAGLTKDVTVIGAGERAEIWDSERWKEYQAGRNREQLKAIFRKIPGNAHGV